MHAEDFMPLPSNLEALWTSYLAEEKNGVRTVALGILEAFVERLTSHPASDWHDWGLQLAQDTAKSESRVTVRMPLFRRVLFPILRLELERGSGAAARVLAAHAQLIYHCKECQSQLPDHLRTEHGLIMEAVRRDPTDKSARLRLRQIYRDRFDYALHELPAGVLYGANGATPAECEEMLSELNNYESLCSELAGEEQDTELIADARFHIEAYREYILSSERQGGFTGFLARKHASADSDSADL